MKHANTCRTTITNQALFTTSPHHPQQQHLATADSGASNIYVAKQDMQMLTNTTPDAPTNITHVQAAEGTIMKSHATGDIVFKGMPNVTFKAQVFEDLQSTLLGVGAIIDKADVKAILSTDGIEFVNRSGDIVLAGPRCEQTGLWNIDLNEHVSKPTLSHGLSVRPLPMDSVADLIE